MLSRTCTRPRNTTTPAPASIRRVTQRNAVYRYSTGTKPRVLVAGCLGQIGSELVGSLRDKYGAENVIGADNRPPPAEFAEQGPFRYIDVRDQGSMEKVIVEERITWLIHYAALLSGSAEQNVPLALQVNINGLHNALELARKHSLRVLVPSSIAAFGPSTPLDNVPDTTIQRPTTVYGVSKVYTEHLGEYYNLRFGVDFRSMRYPGIISYKTAPGGGTTDYAVEMILAAARGEKQYTSFIAENEYLPMMYMPDCLKSTMDLMQADPHSLSQRTYNVAAFSFTPKQLAESVRKFVPDFEVDFAEDFRQDIAKTWPNKLDDTMARRDWGWQNQYDTDAMVKDMLDKLKH
eukprot:gb/GECH01014415.1/.p1 GENE.gb/GECH01014415.1/~~gb/GECH01014415.1/.p1  ORF type:complete len:348 (+),score=74.22 gb/GECH01014415.1/:1-1044(+)